jgi:hypothetical protein
MIFYKNIVVSTILSVIILLAIVAYVMYNSKDKQIYPPILSNCPDYYNLNEKGLCVNTGIWSTRADCNSISFTDSIYKVEGTGANSGICAKKNKATDCKITWDGITNNYSIC